MVKVYVEGGAQDSALDRSLCRKAFSKFFEAAGLAGKRPRTVPCGGRAAAYEAFLTALNGSNAGEVHLLLVDSETAVKKGKTVWEHLKSDSGDNWTKPSRAADDQAFLMVQAMESWFVSDRETLKSFFGAGFREASIPAWPDIEQTPKTRVFEALNQATAECSVRYAKGKVSFELLAEIRPAKVEEASPHAKAFLQRLRSL